MGDTAESCRQFSPSRRTIFIHGKDSSEAGKLLLYPTGFRANRVQVGKVFHMEITQSDSGMQQFVVKTSSGERFQGTSPTTPWVLLAMKGVLSAPLNGIQAFGFKDPFLLSLVQKIDFPKSNFMSRCLLKELYLKGSQISVTLPAPMFEALANEGAETPVGMNRTSLRPHSPKLAQSEHLLPNETAAPLKPMASLSNFARSMVPSNQLAASLSPGPLQQSLVAQLLHRNDFSVSLQQLIENKVAHYYQQSLQQASKPTTGFQTMPTAIVGAPLRKDDESKKGWDPALKFEASESMPFLPQDPEPLFPFEALQRTGSRLSATTASAESPNRENLKKPKRVRTEDDKAKRRERDRAKRQEKAVGPTKRME